MSQLEDQIIECLSGPDYRPIDSGALSKKLGVTKKGMPQFREALDSLLSAGKIREGKQGRLQVKVAAGFVTGTVKKIASGAGFVIPNDSPAGAKNLDVYVSSRDLGDAQTGDEVLVRILSKTRSGGQRCGRVEKVL